jgi:hypothetical protein
MNDGTEELDFGPVNAYLAKSQEEARRMDFDHLAATCERMLPFSGELRAGMRFAVSDGKNPIRVLVELVPGKRGLYFTVLASCDDKIPCKSNSPMTVSIDCVYRGTKPKKTPPLPTNQKGWDDLQGEGASVLRFWYLLCLFKEYSWARLSKPKRQPR